MRSKLSREVQYLRSRVSALENELDVKKNPMEIDLYREQANQLLSENISLRRELRQLKKEISQ